MNGAFPAAITLALLFGGTAHAQDVGADNPIVERTGPNASQPLPDFSETAEFPTTEVTAPPIAPVAGSAQISSIEIAVPQPGIAAIRPDWVPPADPTGALTIDYQRGDTLSAMWIKRQFASNDLIGPEVALDRVISIVQLINRAFVSNGYINSGVLVDGAPPSNGGALKLQLVYGRMVGGEGKLPGLTVTWGENGRNRLSEGYIAARMAAVKQTPVNAAEIERQFRLLAENPAIRTVAANLQPGARPGEAQLAINVDPEPNLDLYVSAANSRSPSIGGERFAVGGSFRHLIRPGDIFSAETGWTGGEQDLILGYEGPFIGTKLLIRGRGGFNNAAVIDPQLRPLDITASDWQAEGGFAFRIIERPLTPRNGDVGWLSARSLTVGLNLAHRESKTTLLGRPFSFSPGAVNGRSEYTALRLTGDFIQRGIGTVLAVSVTATQGLNGTQSVLPNLISPDQDFRAVRAQVSYARRLTESGLELRARLAGQYANGILYSGERFGAGGAQTVRGYRETLVLSDAGLNGSLELAQSFDLGKPSNSGDRFGWGRFAASAFADGALLRNREGPQAFPPEIASIGVTLAWTPSPAITARAIFGQTLIGAPLTGSKDLQDRGFSFRVTVRPLELFRD